MCITIENIRKMRIILKKAHDYTVGIKKENLFFTAVTACFSFTSLAIYGKIIYDVNILRMEETYI